jgi:sarcosine oxidase/L-pipecolate oxidase
MTHDVRTLILTGLNRDSITPTEDFIITPLPKCKNLYLAAGGSFHAWKFLPIIGKYIVQMLDGVLDPQLAKLWAWDPPAAEGAGKTKTRVAFPTLEMRDLL